AAPVAASNCGSLPEVLGTVGLFFDPHDSKNMVEVIEQILANDILRGTMKKNGLIRAQQFMWKKAAQDTLKIFAEVVGK
ncbi:MAG: glycosyltransferase family 1 protein, partial [Actinomycetota bacterium]